MRKEVSNLLVVCGSCQNVGKTTLVKSIIETVSKNHEIVAIKVSPHKHNSDIEEQIFWQSENCIIYLENQISKKDSSQFLQAGANPVFYIETDDSKLELAFEKILNQIGNDKLIICESGALTRFFKPRILIYIESEEHLNTPNSKKNNNKGIADLVILTQSDTLDVNILEIKNKITVTDGKWELKNSK
ncbi:MAG: hypothetical protein WCK02_10710 [Bacteroidota bacterium]